MSFGNATHKLESIPSFKKAEQFFRDTRKPRTKRWAENTRPLYKTSATHYSIVKMDDNTYDLVHYTTSLVRYFRPDADGTHKVWLRGYDSSTSKGFLRAHGWDGRHHSDNGAVYIPLNPYTEHSHNRIFDAHLGIPDGWSARLVFDGHGFLDTARSAHRNIYRRVSSDMDVEKRAQFRQNIAPLLDAMMYRIPLFHDAVSVKTVGYSSRKFTRAIPHKFITPLRAVQTYAVLPDWMPSEEFVSAFTAFAEYYYAHRLPSGASEPLDATTFRKDLCTTLIQAMDLDTTSKKVPLEQFPSTLPWKYYY